MRMENSFVLATHNQGKVREFSRILAPLGIEVCTPALAEVEETGATFEENAFLKAEAACKATGKPAVADDSGLCVSALNGQPGVHSARWAGPDASDADRNALLLERLQSVPMEKRLAKYVCVICCVFPNGDILTARGECEGRIALQPHGTGGFGYDPLFLMADGRTFGEYSAAEKDGVSHRGKASRTFIEDLRRYRALHSK